MLDTLLKPMAGFLQAQHMRRLGIANTMRLAGMLNGVRHRRQLANRKALYHKRFPELIQENGAPAGLIPRMHDGWVLDQSSSQPHLSRLFEDGAKIIAQRGGVKKKEAGRVSELLSEYSRTRRPGTLRVACGKPYRLSDEEVYSVVDRAAVIPMTLPRGTVLFLDPSECFHFGSRNCVQTRHLLMYAYGTACRIDLNEFVTQRHVYPKRPGDSRLAKMVLGLE